MAAQAEVPPGLTVGRRTPKYPKLPYSEGVTSSGEPGPNPQALPVWTLVQNYHRVARRFTATFAPPA